MCITELASRMDGVRTEIKGEAMEAMVGRDRRVRLPGQEVIQSELHEWDEARPQVEREGTMYRGEGGDDMVLSGAYETFGRVGTVVGGRYKLDFTCYRRGSKI